MLQYNVIYPTDKDTWKVQFSVRGNANIESG